MNETALFFNSIVTGLNSLTVVGLIALIVILIFVCLKMGWIKPEWFAIKTGRDEKLDSILSLVQKFDENDLNHTCKSIEVQRINSALEKINSTLESVLVTMNTQAELTRQVVYGQKNICDKYDLHDKQARDIMNTCTNIWEKKCKAF